jgi:hypothetical protein
VKCGRFRLSPIHFAAARKCHSARELHRRSREGTQMLRGGLTARWFVEQTPSDLHGTIASDDPRVRRRPADTQSLCSGQFHSHLRSIGVRSLDRVLVDRRGNRIVLYARGTKHLPPNGTGRGEDQGQ